MSVLAGLTAEANLEWPRVPDEEKYAAFKASENILIKGTPVNMQEEITYVLLSNSRY